MNPIEHFRNLLLALWILLSPRLRQDRPDRRPLVPANKGARPADRSRQPERVKHPRTPFPATEELEQELDELWGDPTLLSTRLRGKKAQEGILLAGKGEGVHRKPPRCRVCGGWMDAFGQCENDG